VSEVSEEKGMYIIQATDQTLRAWTIHMTFEMVSFYQDICELTTSIYIPRGVNVNSLSREVKWPFQPSKLFKVSCGT